ncbi:MAG: SBBP repeat-containing protein [Candidatus Zixiibacteriota bacterium]
MLKPLKVVFGMVLLVLFVGPVSQMLSEAEAFAQTVDTAWVRRYNGPANDFDVAHAMAVDNLGNVIVTGHSVGSGTSEDYATIKYDSDGDTLWLRIFNGAGNTSDQATALAVDDSGCVYVTGGSGSDCVTIKYDPFGDTLWVRKHPSGWPYAIAVDDSGYVFVAGCSGGDYITIKYYPSGDTGWVRRYDGPANDYDDAYAMTLDASGNIYVTGASRGSGTLEDYATIKYYPNGDTAWVRRYSGSANDDDEAKAIAVDGSDNVFVTGYSWDGNSYNYVTIKYNPFGDTAWVRTYDGAENDDDDARAIAVDNSGNAYVTGSSFRSETYGDFTTIKYYSNGDTAWLRRYDGPVSSEDYAYAMAVDSSNNIYVTGPSYGSGTREDYATVKYDSSGNELWVARYNGPANANDEPLDIAVDDSNNVYVTGWSAQSLNYPYNYDYATIKYVQTPSGVKDETGGRERPSEFDLSQNYPNPFNPTTKIEFTLAKSGFVTLQIYDVLGRKVRTLVSEEVSSGYKSVIWDGKNGAGQDVASGVYFYQLKVGDFSEPKKMLLLK